MFSREYVIWVEPMGAPRQTRADKWKKRPVILRYHAYSDTIRAQVKLPPELEKPAHVGWTAYFTMPESWSQKKKNTHAGQLHFSKPDRDNVDKGILDALFSHDQSVSTGTIVKLWDDGMGARIEITIGDSSYAHARGLPRVLGEEVPSSAAA